MSRSIETRCIHGNSDFSCQDTNKAVSFPIYQTATFGHIGVGQSTGFDYSRVQNPTRQRLEETISALEGARDTVAFATGMAAVSACFELFQPGDHIICSEDLYGGATRLLQTIGSKNGLAVDFVDTTDAAQIRAKLRPCTRALYIETPSNPMMNITDLHACAQIAREQELLLIVDNTFLSPYLQNPIELGADIVLHSGTKFLSGHNDTLSGFLSCASQELADRVRMIAKTTGGILAPFDCWLMLRGIKTLSVRMERQQENALRVARWLKTHPKITRVYYAGLPEHPGYEINARQARGAGSMISFRTDSVETARRVLEKVRLITFAESLGGTESLITYPVLQTHNDVPQDMRERLGITETLLRLSVGLEHVDDIIADLKQALEE
ncbi:MAG: PLP-dependent transferase [Oscillospiraceae bacterium]|nr:PLP-dependent transferase [Oscillospiraceae bacterium]MBQ8835712.1 PLP-dependent transferase [Oscillospiraceae bacterium]